MKANTPQRDPLERIAESLARIAQHFDSGREADLRAECQRLTAEVAAAMEHAIGWERVWETPTQASPQQQAKRAAAEQEVTRSCQALETFLAAHPEFRQADPS